MKDLIQIGKLGKAHGTKGELRVFVEDHYEEVLMKSAHIFVEQHGHKLPYFITSVKDKVHLLVKFEDVNGKEAAAALANAPIFLPQSILPEPAEDDSLAAWIGFTIQDKELGSIGEITDLLEMKDQFLAQITYEGKTVFVPLHEDLILDIQPAQKVILMDLPEGLLEI